MTCVYPDKVLPKLRRAEVAVEIAATIQAALESAFNDTGLTRVGMLTGTNEAQNSSQKGMNAGQNYVSWRRGSQRRLQNSEGKLRKIKRLSNFTTKLDCER